MDQKYTMLVEDIFHFKDGRTILTGVVDDGPPYISRGRFEVWLDGEYCGSLDVEGEMIANQTSPARAKRLRALSMTDKFQLDRESITNKRLVLRFAEPIEHRRAIMHRHLIGVDSPEPDYIADPMTQGPMLPEGWDGDAWVRTGGRGYFVRAWLKRDLRVAYGRGETYEEARRQLLDDIASGSRRVVITAAENRAGS